MKNAFITLALSLTLLCSGCIEFVSTKQIPKGNEGKAKQTETTKEKITGHIEGDIELPEILWDENGKPIPYPVQRIKVDGVEAELPAGTKGKLSIGVSGKTSSYNFTEIMSSWKLNSAPVQLFVFGGLLVAAGVGLALFGMARIGIVAGAMGAALIACGVVINQFPWVILIVVALGLAAGGYFVYDQYKKKQIKGENQDQSYVLERLVQVVSRLPDDVLEKYIKEPLKTDDQSGLIRRITRKARGLE